MGAAALGTKLGRYQIVKHLASGGMAEVLLARASGIEGFTRHVVIKRIRPGQATDASFVQMFLNEARLAAQLHHHHIVQVHDIGQEGNEYFFAMEYVHGEDLRRLLTHLARHKQKLPLEHVVTIITAAATALHHAHEQLGPDRKPLGIVHRDVTPANILVGYDGSVKVADFGIAKAAARTAEATQAGTLKGKASYMSPEQCTGSASLDRRSDVFALGIVLYELATTRRLFKAANDFLTMSAIVSGKVPSPREQRPDMPLTLEAIILKALAQDPGDRFQTADEMRVALDAFATAAQLRTTTGGLAAFMKSQFGEKPEPWLVETTDDDAASSSAPVVDFDGSASGVAPAPQKSVDNLDLPDAVAVTSDAPILRARTKAISVAPPMKTPLPPVTPVVAPIPAKPRALTHQIPARQATGPIASDKPKFPRRDTPAPIAPQPARQRTITVQIPVAAQTAAAQAKLAPGESSGVPLPGVAKHEDSGASGVPQPIAAKREHSGSSGVPQPIAAKREHSGSSGVPQPIAAKREQSRSAGAPQPIAAKREHSGSAGAPQPIAAKREQSGSSGAPQPIAAKREQSGASGVPQPIAAKREQSGSAGAPQPIAAKREQSGSAGAPQPIVAKREHTGSAGAPQPIAAKREASTAPAVPTDVDSSWDMSQSMPVVTAASTVAAAAKQSSGGSTSPKSTSTPGAQTTPSKSSPGAQTTPSKSSPVAQIAPSRSSPVAQTTSSKSSPGAQNASSKSSPVAQIAPSKSSPAAASAAAAAATTPSPSRTMTAPMGSPIGNRTSTSETDGTATPTPSVVSSTDRPSAATPAKGVGAPSNVAASAASTSRDRTATPAKEVTPAKGIGATAPATRSATPAKGIGATAPAIRSVTPAKGIGATAPATRSVTPAKGVDPVANATAAASTDPNVPIGTYVPTSAKTPSGGWSPSKLLTPAEAPPTHVPTSSKTPSGGWSPSKLLTPAEAPPTHVPGTSRTPSGGWAPAKLLDQSAPDLVPAAPILPPHRFDSSTDGTVTDDASDEDSAPTRVDDPAPSAATVAAIAATIDSDDESPSTVTAVAYEEPMSSYSANGDHGASTVTARPIRPPTDDGDVTVRPMYSANGDDGPSTVTARPLRPLTDDGDAASTTSGQAYNGPAVAWEHPLAAADAHADDDLAGRESAPALPPPPAQHGSRAPSNSDDVTGVDMPYGAGRAQSNVSTIFGDPAGAMSYPPNTWPTGSRLVQTPDGFVKKLLASPKRLAVIGGSAALCLVVVFVFAFGGGDKPAPAKQEQTGEQPHPAAATPTSPLALPSPAPTPTAPTAPTAQQEEAPPAPTPPSPAPAPRPKTVIKKPVATKRVASEKKPVTKPATTTKPKPKPVTAPTTKPKKPAWDPNALFPTKKK